jgi:hypothetical protein
MGRIDQCLLRQFLQCRLLEGGHSTIAGRLAGAFRNIGRERIADDIIDTMRAAGYGIRENDPFADFLARLVDAEIQGKPSPEITPEG